MSIIIINRDDEFERLLDRDYLRRPQYKRQHVNQLTDITPIYNWCIGQFGPSANKFLAGGTGREINLERTWLTYRWNFYFRDPDEAMWFRFRWG